MLKLLLILCFFTLFFELKAQTPLTDSIENPVQYKFDMRFGKREPIILCYCEGEVFEAQIVYNTSSGLVIYKGQGIAYFDKGLNDTLEWDRIDSIKYEGLVRRKTSSKMKKLIFYSAYTVGAFLTLSSVDIDGANSVVLLLPIIPASLLSYSAQYHNIKDTIAIPGSELPNLVLQAEWRERFVLLDSAPAQQATGNEVLTTSSFYKRRYDDHRLQFNVGISYPDMLRGGISAFDAMSTPFEISVRAAGNSFLGLGYHPESYSIYYQKIDQSDFGIQSRMFQKSVLFIYEYSIMRKRGVLTTKADIMIGFTLRYSIFNSYNAVYFHQTRALMDLNRWQEETVILGLRFSVDRMMGEHLFLNISMDQTFKEALEKDIIMNVSSGNSMELNAVKFPLSHTSLSFGLGLRF